MRNPMGHEEEDDHLVGRTVCQTHRRAMGSLDDGQVSRVSGRTAARGVIAHAARNERL
jgi:hypothetical protein